MHAIMEERVVSDLALYLTAKRPSSIQVAVIPRKIATRDFDPELVSCLKYLCSRPEVNFKTIDLSRLHQFRL